MKSLLIVLQSRIFYAYIYRLISIIKKSFLSYRTFHSSKQLCRNKNAWLKNHLEESKLIETETTTSKFPIEKSTNEIDQNKTEGNYIFLMI